MRLRAWQDALEVEASGFTLAGLERVGLIALVGSSHAASPPVGQSDVAGIEQIVDGGRADLVWILTCATTYFERELLPVLCGFCERCDEFGHVWAGGVLCAEFHHHREEMLESHSLRLQGFTRQQIDGLDAGGAFVNRGDAGIARKLFHAPLTNVAVAAKTLHCMVGTFDRPLGQAGFDDGGEER